MFGSLALDHPVVSARSEGKLHSLQLISRMPDAAALDFRKKYNCKH